VHWIWFLLCQSRPTDASALINESVAFLGVSRPREPYIPDSQWPWGPICTTVLSDINSEIWTFEVFWSKAPLQKGLATGNAPPQPLSVGNIHGAHTPIGRMLCAPRNQVSIGGVGWGASMLNHIQPWYPDDFFFLKLSFERCEVGRKAWYNASCVFGQQGWGLFESHSHIFVFLRKQNEAIPLFRNNWAGTKRKVLILETSYPYKTETFFSGWKMTHSGRYIMY
jgi:hypothetical protein